MGCGQIEGAWSGLAEGDGATSQRRRDETQGGRGGGEGSGARDSERGSVCATWSCRVRSDGALSSVEAGGGPWRVMGGEEVSPVGSGLVGRKRRGNSEEDW